MNISQIDQLLNRGFKIDELHFKSSNVYIRLESPKGQVNTGQGADISEATINALIHMTVKLEEYLIRAEVQRDNYKAGYHPIFETSTHFIGTITENVVAEVPPVVDDEGEA